MPFLKLPQPKQTAAAASASKVERDAREWIETIVADSEYVDPAESKSPVERKPVRDVLLDDAPPFGAVPKSSSRNAIDWITDPTFKAVSGRRVIRQSFASSYNDEIEFRLCPFVIPHDAVFEVSVRPDAIDRPTSISFATTKGQSVTWSKTDTGFARDATKPAEIVPGQWNKLTL